MTHQPIYNEEAEKEILGAIMLDNDSIRSISLKTTDFYLQRHARIYEAMLKLNMDSLPIDYAHIKPLIKESDFANLIKIVNETVTSANIKTHARLVTETSQKRTIQRLGLQLQQQAEESELGELLSIINQTVENIYRRESTDIIPMSVLIKEIYEGIERRAKESNKLSGIPSGFIDLDRLTDGFQPGEYIVIAGRPSMGKTAFALNICHNATEASEVPVGFISIEMGKQQLGIRSLSIKTQIEMYKLRKGKIKNNEWLMLSQGASDLAELPIHFDFSAFELSEIQKTFMLMAEKHKCKLIAIDYLQLADVHGMRKREQEVATISRILKNLARKYNVCCIALCQLNRNPEREERRPILADLRESGAIEQDADIVLFIYREKKDSSVTEIIIGKGRNIGQNIIKLQWDGDTQTFRNLEGEN